jgi:hypothetical protein
MNLIKIKINCLFNCEKELIFKLIILKNKKETSKYFDILKIKDINKLSMLFQR